MKPKKILISTGIYPPEIGGPAQYALRLKQAFEKSGHTVSISTFGFLKKFPTGVRHILFFKKVFFQLIGKDVVIILDTFSAGVPTVAAARILKVPTIVRTGGDFLWESYVERTDDLVLFKDFYQTSQSRWSKKENNVFCLTKWMLSHTTRIVFSTAWQKDIFEKAYGLDVSKNSIIENYYGGEKSTNTYSGGKKVFVAGTRVLKWKNIALLKEAFAEAQREVPDIELDLSNEPYEAFMKKIRASYSVILTSLGDISPNMILDALRHGTPAIFTRENGINNRIKDHVLLVNPQSKEDIVKAIKEIADPVKREEYKKKAEQFSFEHNWDNIAREFISLYEKIV